MSAAIFEFFELVAEEVCDDGSKVITPDSLKAKGKDSSLLDDLQSDLKANSAEEAIKLAVEELEKHFKGKGAALPFDYEPSTGLFQAKDVEFLRFVKEMSGIRSSGRRSRDFECRVAERLQARATGTIHRVELAACIAAMDWVKEEGIGRRYSRVQIFSDSQYVVDRQFSAPYWQKAKWRNSAGRPVANWELWKEFLSSRSKAGVRVDICKVRNKSTSLLQRVDKLARAAAESHPRIDRGLVVGKIGRAKIKGSATMFPAACQVLVIRIVGSKTVGREGENRFVFEVFDENTSAYLSKHRSEERRVG